MRIGELQPFPSATSLNEQLSRLNLVQVCTFCNIYFLHFLKFYAR